MHNSATIRSLVDIVRDRANECPAKTGYIFLSEDGSEAATWSFGDLEVRARAVGAALQELGLEGQRALLLYPSGLDFVVGFLGCLYAGVVAVPAYPPRSERALPRLLAIARDARPAVVLSTSVLQSRSAGMAARYPELAALPWIATDTLPVSGAEAWRDPEATPGTLAFLQYTSGSTAQPKGVMVTHGNLLHNEETIRLAFRQSQRSRIVSWLPLYHDMGLIGGVLQPLFLGAVCILMSPMTFLQRPRRWLEAITRYRATTSGGPNFAYDLCARKIAEEEREGLNLRTWSVAFNGAEPVRRDTLERFARAFATCGFRRRAFYPCYGLAEATLFVAGGRAGAGPAVQPFQASGLERGRAVATGEGPGTRSLVACGRPWLGQKVTVVDPASGKLCRPGRIGEILVSGSSVARGYWGRPDETARDFESRLPESGDGPFLRTGDLGFLHRGRLFITGRLKDLIILRGRNIHPQDLELTAERSHPALRPGCGAAFAVEAGGEERVVLIQEVARHAPAEAVAAAIRAAVAEEHEVALYEIVLLRAQTLPKTSSGKVQRHACRRAWQDGSLEALWRSGTAAAVAEITRDSPQPESSIEDGLRLAVGAVLRLDPAAVEPSVPLTALGLDSMAAVELAGRLEKDFRRTSNLADLLAGATLEDLVCQARVAMAAGPALRVAVPLPEGGSRPVSRGQQALWLLERLQPGNPAYVIARAARLRGELDVDLFHRCLRELLRRHEALRTNLESGPEGLRAVARSVEEIDAGDWFGEVEGSASLAAEAWRPFDLESGPLLRVRVWRVSSNEHVLLLSAHHVALDLWSLGVLLRELGILYGAKGPMAAPLEALPASYADFAWREAQRLERVGTGELLAYWERRLQGLPPLELPADRPRPPVQTYRGACQSRRLGHGLEERLAAVARDAGATPFMALLAGFAALLHRCSGQEDFAVGCPTAGREEVDLHEVVGYFVNPVALRMDLSGSPSFAELVERTRACVLEDFRHQGAPFPFLVESLQPERDPSRSPLFQALFVFHKERRPEEEGLAGFAVGDPGAELCLGSLRLECLPLEERGAQFDLTLTAASVRGRLVLSLQYATDLFEEATVERWLGHLENLLALASSRPEERLGNLALLSEGERRQLLVEWNDTARPWPQGRCLHELVAEQASRTPEAVAVVGDAGEQVTYDELLERSRSLAGWLQTLGVKPEVGVGVCLSRTPRLVETLLGVLQAGGFYVPLDPAYPRERLRFHLEDSAAKVVLTESELAVLLPEDGPVRVCLDEGWPRGRWRAPGVDPENLAYVIYTSGSTGRPKAVGIRHSGAAALVGWALEAYSAQELSGVLASTSVCFDLSVYELFVPLCSGGKVILAANALELPWLESAAEVTLVNTVPSAMAELVRQKAVPESVRVVNLAGEALSRELSQRVHGAGVGRLFNLYGPSEDTTYSTWEEVERGSERVTIGRSLPNSRAYVVSRHGGLQAVGVAGELWLGGEGLARGYLGRAELTAERFVPDPFVGVPGERLYRTGDLVRRLGDGRLEFLGRIDHQVKVRGFRIELGEVEAALGELAGVRECALAVGGEGGDRHLVAYVVGEAGVEELRAGLRRRLPEYMVPGLWVKLEALPRTPNGKLDRRALPVPSREVPGASSAQTPLEELLSGLWSELLGVAQVGRSESFFDLGGHSLLAARLVSRVRQHLGVELPLRAVFEAPTLAELARRVESARGMAPLPPVRRAGREGALPLSYSQERLWFLDRLEPDRPTYNLPAGLWLEGALDPSALAGALGRIVARHESLRTTFVAPSGRPEQRISPPGACELPWIDLGGLAPERARLEARRLADQEARRPFDLERGPLLRTALVRLSGQEHLLLLNLHHIVADGASVAVLGRELSSLYGQRPLPELPVQYADYAIWQRSLVVGLGRELAYWQDCLAGAPAGLDLPSDRPRPAVPSGRGATVAFALPPAVLDQAVALGRRHGATPFMVLLAAWSTLLLRCSGQDDFTIGSPVANRRTGEIEGLIGFFVNTLVLRCDLSGDPGFGELLERLRVTTLAAYDHQDLPFERLVEALAPERSRSRTPLFQTMLVLQSGPRPELALPGLAARLVGMQTGTAKFDLTLTFEESGHGLAGWLEHSSDLFDPATARRLLDHFSHLLEAAVESPHRVLSELPLLGEAERHQVLSEWGSVASFAGEAQCLHSLFERRARQEPWAEVLIAGRLRLTCADLDSRASRLARRLRALGIGPEVRVGICATRGPGLVVGLLAILKAGGAYVPIDPEYPAERLAFMLEDSGVALLLTENAVARRLPATDLPRLLLDEEDLSGEGSVPLELGAGPGNLAYVIYTSGSTGRPKGVAIEHRSAVAFLRWAREVFGPEDLAGALACTSICFDLSVFELFAPLSWGGRVVLAENALALPDLPAAEEVTLVNTVPSAMAELVAAGALPASLRTVNLAGEPLNRELAAAIFRRAGSVRLFNLYGPSEDTTYSTFSAVADDRGAPRIGRPIAGTSARILDRTMRPVPVGIPGEIYLGGDGLARGYLGRPDLTAERFVPDPWGDAFGGRLYRTGDLARFSPDGEIEFLGRTDQQVKVRGFRIELGEIESVLASHPAVSAAVVTAGEGPAGDRRLTAYVVAAGEAAPKAGELRVFLRGRLPEFMVPSAWVTLPKLPLTPSGKVDRRALPAPGAPDPGTAPSGSPLEELLAGLWAGLLGLERVGVHDSFFDLGGHSLLAVRMLARLREELGVEIRLSTLFDHPTVAGLASAIETVRQSEVPAPPLCPRPRSSEIPLSAAQRRIWFLHRLWPESTAYHLPVAVHLQGPLDRGALERSLGEVVRRHEALRTSFPLSGGRPVQAVVPPAAQALPEVDLTALPAERRRAAAGMAMDRLAAQPFDLARGGLLRTAILRLGGEEHVLVTVLHHIISDGWSLDVFTRELSAFYGAFRGGRPSPLPPLPVQVADHALWQRELEEKVLGWQLAYWRDRLVPEPPPLRLPTDGGSGALGGRQDLVLQAGLSAALARLGRYETSTLFMTLLAGLSVLLHRQSGETDLIVGTPVAGRNDVRTEGLIGCFLNTLALRIDLSGDPPFRDLLRRVRRTVLDAHDHQDVPFERIVEELQPNRDLGRNPLFDILLNFVNTPRPVPVFDGLEARPVEVGDPEPKLAMTLYAEEVAGRLHLRLVHRGCFSAGRMACLLDQLVHLLEQATARPDAPISSLSLVLPGRAPRLPDPAEPLTAPPYPTVAEAFASCARNFAHRPAVRHRGRSWSYAELEATASAVSARLRGGRPGAVVAVRGARSFGLIASVLGALLSRKVLLPLDPGLPGNRQRLMLAESRAELLLQVGAPPPDGGLGDLALEVEAVDPDLGMSPGEPAGPGPGPEDPAYVFFTSGTTGMPKGVLGQHKGLSHFLAWQRGTFAISPEDRSAQLIGLSFDAVLRDILMPLTAGATLCLPDDAELGSSRILPWLERERITVLHTVPALARSWLAHLPPGLSVPSLRWVFFSGEPLTDDLVRRWRAAFPGCSVINLYGPTETTMTKCFYRVPDEPLPGVQPLGVPMPDTQALVLGPGDQPCGVGEPGEIVLRTPFRTLGYLNDLDRGGGRFFPNPWRGDGDDLLYRTGDRGRYRPDGLLEILGRLDHQVKIRGVRVELPEIELRLASHPAVREAVVVAREAAEGSGEVRLAGYFVPRDGQPVAASELRVFLRRELPEALVPAALVSLDHFPLNANGKVDRAALPEPAGRPELEARYMPPQNGLERAIAGIWSQALGLPAVGLHDNFFDLGGHSLLLIEVQNQLQVMLGRHVPMVELFRHPTVYALSLLLGREEAVRPAFEESRGRAQARRESLRQREHHAAERGRRSTGP